jgi:amidase
LEIAGETVVNALRPTLDKLAALVRMPEPVIVADEPLSRWMDYFRVLQAAEAWACHGEWIAREKPALGPGVKERFAWAPTVRPEDITRATARREEIARRLAELLEGRTVLALPSAPGIAVPRNSPPEVLDDLRVRALALLCIAGLARLPQISLPLATGWLSARALAYCRARQRHAPARTGRQTDDLNVENVQAVQLLRSVQAV